MPRPPLYFIGTRPARDCPPPPGGWEVFSYNKSKNVREIVNTLKTNYREAFIGARGLPEPHVFFNKHNDICCNFCSRHFPANFNKAVALARQQIEEESDEEYPPSPPSSANKKPSKRTPTSSRKTSGSTPQVDPPPLPEKSSIKMNYAPLQSKREADAKLPNPQVQFPIQQFQTGNKTETFKLKVPANYERDDIVVQRDSDNKHLAIAKFFGVSDIDDHETVEQAYTGGNMIVDGGRHNGRRICMRGNEAYVQYHKDYLRGNATYESGFRVGKEPPHCFQAIEFEEEIENGLKFELVGDTRSQTAWKDLYVDVIYASASPDEMAAFSSSPMAILEGCAGNRHHAAWNQPPPPYPHGSGGRGGGFGGGRGGGHGGGGGGGGGYNHPPPPPAPAPSYHHAPAPAPSYHHAPAPSYIHHSPPRGGPPNPPTYGPTGGGGYGIGGGGGGRSRRPHGASHSGHGNRPSVHRPRPISDPSSSFQPQFNPSSGPG